MMRNPVEGTKPRPTGQRTSIHGRPKGKFTIGDYWGWKKRAAKKKLKNKITAKKTREKIREAIEDAWDKATFGKLRRKIDRLRKHGPVTHNDTADAALPQTETYCHRYIGKKADPLTSRPMDKKGRPVKGQAYCPSCKVEVTLERGRIPQHKPGPPPYTHCPRCNAYFPHVYRDVPNAKKLRRIGGCFNDIMCPACYRDVEVEGGGTTWTTPDGDIILPHEHPQVVNEGLAW